MLNRLYNSISLFLLSTALTACWSYSTSLSYSEDLKHGYASSKPIYLASKETKDNSFYFLLSHKLNSEEFLLKVRWISKTKVKQFNGQKSALKLLIDNEEIISLTPVKPVKTVAFHIDPPATEEEATYSLTREELTRISLAKSVTVDLQGKYVNKIAYFNKIHTFRAFKDFLKNG